MSSKIISIQELRKIDKLVAEKCKNKLNLQTSTCVPIYLLNDYRNAHIDSDGKEIGLKSSFLMKSESNYLIPKLVDDEDESDDEFYLPSAPGGGCSSYIGNRNTNIRSSNVNTKSSNIDIKHSNLLDGSSNIRFSSSDDILNYLKSHPDFIRLPPSLLDAILAAILSGLLLCGGIALAIITAGGSLTACTFLATSLTIGVGAVGLQNAVSGIINKNFSWSSFAKSTLTNGFLTLISFGAGFAAGGLVGMALLSQTALTETCIKTIGTVVGSIAGSSVRTGTFVIIKKISGEKIEALQITLEALQGAVVGGYGGFLGVKAVLVDPSQVANVSSEDKIFSESQPGSTTDVYKGDFLKNIDVGDLERLFNQTPFIPQEAFKTVEDVLNIFLNDPNAVFPVLFDPNTGTNLITLFHDRGGDLARLLGDAGYAGPFRFYEFDVRTFLYWNRGPERIVMAFSGANAGDPFRGFVGSFYTFDHYRTFTSFAFK